MHAGPEQHEGIWGGCGEWDVVPPLHSTAHDGHGGQVVETLLPAADDSFLAMAVSLAGQLRSAREYTDMEGFTLMCGVCSKGLTGQEAARAHAKETGHTNFQEYDPDKVGAGAGAGAGERGRGR
jgi:hypothetical protein